MKRLFLCFVAAVVCVTARADEGMWLLPYLQKMNIKDMQDKGCKLSAEDIYSLNHAALKDAIVVFGNGCTGEVVSPEGLLFTNHHCGYGSIQALSSVEHDYLKYGFWAMSNQEELPAPGLEVRFVRKIADVTPLILGNVPSIAKQDERNEIVKQNSEALITRLQSENPGMEIIVKPFFGGNQYFSFVIEVFSDIRLVGTPPDAIGKFGGDTDNWMWPRHTCDFAVFRIYADKENKPASYSPENVPYKAKKYLKVSLDGYKEGDFDMIMGFPGRTMRYMTSYEIDQLLEVSNPQCIFIRGERQAILEKDMAASDAVRIQYASKYALSSNKWKNSIGMSRGLKKLNVKAKKQAQEAAFQQWAEQNTLPEEGFIDALNTIRTTVHELTPLMATIQYMEEAMLISVEIAQPAMLLKMLGQMKKSEVKELSVKVDEALAEFYKDYNVDTDRKISKRMLHIMRENMKELPSFFTTIDQEFGGNIDAYVDNMYDHSAATDMQKVSALMKDFSKKKIESDPAVQMAESLDAFMNPKKEEMIRLKEQLAEGQRLYIAGLMRMQPDKAWASDANFTLRLTYGQILPYDPADGVHYKYFTTLAGVMAKEDATNPDFIVPEKLKELYEARDYGCYADKDGTLHVAFLSNCDITGGNSGSPTLNAKGELIGLAFDGNWEAMSGDVAFEPAVQRTISVDVRYVLFIIDKFGGAGWLLDEMDLVQSPIK